jgi:hypothetical protein
MERGKGLREKVGSEGSVFFHKKDIWQIRVYKEVREHGQGDGDKSVTVQHVHEDDP